MPYRLYLKKSFRKRGFRHLAFFAILVCTMTIPLLMTIYRSSYMEGYRQFVYENTRGAVYQLDHAREEDLAVFAEVEEVKAVYEDGSIWFYPAGDADRMQEDGQAVHDGYGLPDEDDDPDFPEGRLWEIACSIGREESELMYVADFGKDESFDDWFRTQAIIDWSLTGLCLLILLSACGNHLRRFRADIGTLRAAGAARVQIAWLFWEEFLITAVPAGLLAMIAAGAEMRLLYRFFIEVKGSILSWNVYCADIGMMLQHIAAFLVAGSLFTVLYILYLCRCGILSLVRGDILQRIARRTVLGIARRRSPEGVVSSILLRRSSRPLAGCAFITVIAVTGVSLAINYLTIRSVFIQQWPEYDVTVQTPYFDAGIPEECITAIMRMEEVETAEKEKSLYPHSYLALDSRLTGISESSWGGVGGALTSIRNAKDAYPELNETMGRQDVIVTAGFTGLPYREGDIIRLQPTDFYPDEEGCLHSKAPVSLKVAGLADLPPDDSVLTVWLSDALYEELTRELPAGAILIKLKDPASAPDVVRKLTEAYPILDGSVTDYCTPFLEMKRINTGEILMYSTLAGLMLLSLFCILFFRIMEYLTEQQPVRKTLRSIGAAQTVVRKAYSRQIFSVFAASTVIALLAGYRILQVYLFYTGSRHYYTPLNIVLHAAAVALTGLVCAFPVRLVFNQKTSREDCNNG